MRRNFVVASLVCLLASPLFAQVKLGIDVLRDENFAVLKGKRVGLICHPASVDSRMISTIDVFRATKECQLAALFGPEHGVYGDSYGGKEISTTQDSRTHLTAYSLYGKTRRPTTQMVKSVDVMIYDLQDVGSRSYTFTSTLRTVLEECAEQDVELIVLDRPNPLGGLRIEGPPTVEKEFESFISYYPVPYVHGLTTGELSQYLRAKYAPNFKKLTVIKMQGWKRTMTWRDTGLEWVATSPHIPTPEAAVGYAATGFLGELGQLSNGVGYTLPFTAVGAPWVNGDELTATLTGSTAATRPASMTPETGVRYRTIRYKPFFATFKEEPCQGVQIAIDAHSAENFVEINFRILDALGAKGLFERAAALDSASKNLKDKEKRTHYIRSWDITCGSDVPRKWMSEGKPLAQLFAQWKAGCDQFRESRKPYLLYP